MDWAAGVGMIPHLLFAKEFQREMAGSSCNNAELAGEAPIMSPASTRMLRASWPAMAAFKYADNTAALPTLRPDTVLPAEICPWKSLMARILTDRGVDGVREKVCAMLAPFVSVTVTVTVHG